VVGGVAGSNIDLNSLGRCDSGREENGGDQFLQGSILSGSLSLSISVIAIESI
jgi:hypothetical protein